MAKKKRATRQQFKSVKKSGGKPTASVHAKRAAQSPLAANARISFQSNSEVDIFMKDLSHPLKQELESIRQLILGISPEIREGTKWNSPSFRTTDWFATVNVAGAGRPPRPADPPSLRLILHTGAKVKASATKGLEIADPTGLLKWLAKDRAMVTFDASSNSVMKRQLRELAKIILQWIGQV